MREPKDDKIFMPPLKLFIFFIYGAMVIFTSYYQLFLQDLGMTKLEIGSILAIGPLVSLAANPFWRYWSSRLQNTRRTLLLMMVGTLLVVQFLFHADTYVMVYTTMIFVFFFQIPIFSHSNTLILGYIQDTKYSFGPFRWWGTFGWAITAIFTGFVLDWAGISKINILFTSLLLLGIGMLAILPPHKNTPWSPPIQFSGLRAVLSNRYFMFFILLGIIVAVPNTMNNTFMSLYITELGGSKAMVGFAVFLSAVLEVAVFLLFNRFVKQQLSWLVATLALASLLFAIRWLLMSQAVMPIEIAFIQLLHCVTFAGYFYVGTQLTRLFLPSPYRATGQAIYTLTWSGISGAVGALAGGWLYQSFGAEAMYETGMLFALIGAGGFGWMWSKIRKQGYPPPADLAEELPPPSNE